MSSDIEQVVPLVFNNSTVGDDSSLTATMTFWTVKTSIIVSFDGSIQLPQRLIHEQCPPNQRDKSDGLA